MSVKQLHRVHRTNAWPLICGVACVKAGCAILDILPLLLNAFVTFPNDRGSHLLCCFCLALSQMAGLSCNLLPSLSVQFLAHTTTPKQDFFKIWQL